MSMILLMCAAIAAPSAVAEPLQPGDGDGFFISDIRGDQSFSPTPTVSAIRAIIPLAHRVCDARANGQDDLQAAQLVWTGNGVQTLGLASGSTSGLESLAMDIVGAATLAYCPTYSSGNW